MENEFIQNLLKKYENYEGSTAFIYAVQNSLGEFKDNHFVKAFIKNTFNSNDIDYIDKIICKKLSAHWRNISDTKLSKNDYSGYYYAMITSMNLQIVADYLENNHFNSQI